MAVIHVLDKHTAELIAAGEVVERPASVVKELLENAIDAGASQITVTIESGGVKLIEISDNGSGIEAEYIPTAFIRHATSKIRTEDDLNHIHTLGFRGEALASIASVARVEVLTRTENDECASVYRIEGGEDYPLEPGARGVGTTIRVQDLFYNTPARMKFLKKDSSEGTFVADIVAHVATEIYTLSLHDALPIWVSCSMSPPVTASCAVPPTRCWAGNSAVTSWSWTIRKGCTGCGASSPSPGAAAPAAVCSISTSMGAMSATAP